MKFDTGDLKKIYVEEPQALSNWTEILDILHDDLSVCHIVGCAFSTSTGNLSVFITLLTTIQRENSFFPFHVNMAKQAATFVTSHIIFLPRYYPPIGEIAPKKVSFTFP